MGEIRFSISHTLNLSPVKTAISDQHKNKYFISKEHFS